MLLEKCIVFSYPRYTETRKTQLVKISHCLYIQNIVLFSGIKRKAADWDEREYKNRKMNHEIEELHAVKEGK